MAYDDSREELLNLDISGFSVLRLESGVLYSSVHWHTAIELGYCMHGQGTCRCGEVEIPVSAGSLVLINSLEVHSYWSQDHFDFVCIHIESQAIDRFMPDFSQLRFDLKKDGLTAQAVSAKKQLMELVQTLVEVERSRPEGYQLKGQALLFEIAALLVRDFSIRVSQNERETVQRDILRLEPLVAHIQKHHAEELTLEDAAGYMGLNKAYFCRLFKRTIGVPFVRYLNMIRVIAVARDLTNTDNTISELMERHGFRNQKLFNQIFREIYGCTPSQKRKELQRVEQQAESE